MKKPLIALLGTAVVLLASGAALAADVPHAQTLSHQMLPQLYVDAEAAQAVCPTDQVVWVNWSARVSHLPDDRWYGHTTTGAYACAGASAAAGVKPASR